MGYQKRQSPPSPELWGLAYRQHGVVSRRQLLELGLHPQAIKHRLAKGRLHPLWRGVYAVGRPQVSRHGRWMGAVLACGPAALLSYESAAGLWQIRAPAAAPIDVSTRDRATRSRKGIRTHRRARLPADETSMRFGIPVTSPLQTLLDLATLLPAEQLEAAVNEADKRDLTAPEALRAALAAHTGRSGVAVLRNLLDRRTFTLTDSELERRFLPLARDAGLPAPQTGAHVNGFKVDFFWPELGLVVETDGLRYHRTAAQQAKDGLRDQRHSAAGLTPLRFTHAQVRFEPVHVRGTLTAVADRLRGA